jgi:4-hydroxy-4-methyl-2-oxoglutarate aldolase
MIEEPPLLQILSASSRNRPTEAQIAPFKGALTGNICDALGGSGALDMAIKPLPGCPGSLCGPALTVDCGARDVLAMVAAMSEVRAGDVMVQAVDGFQGCAAIGDLVSGMAKNAGAEGIVTDGPVRDIGGIEALDLPIFATGINPNSPFGKGPGRIGYPVMIGGMTVHSGDLIVGDRDGVVVVPFDRIDDVAKALGHIQQAEAVMEAKVADGLILPDDIKALLDSPAVARE